MASQYQMLEAPSVKRRRTDMTDTFFPGPSDFHRMISSLPPRVIRDSLAHAAHEHPDVAVRLINERHKNAAFGPAESEKIDFRQHFAMVCRALKRFDQTQVFPWDFSAQAQDVAEEIRDYIVAIGKATPANATKSTKSSAFQALYDIGSTLVCSPVDDLRFEMLGFFAFDDILEDTMLQIAKNLTMKEREAFDHFDTKLLRLQKQGKEWGVFAGLRDVRNAL